MSFLADVQGIVTARSPSTVQDARFTLLVSLAEKQLSSSCMGDFFAYAGALLVLHWLTLDERGGASGAITSEKEGDLARSYSVSSNAEYWESTHWGAELQRLKKSTIFRPRTRMMPSCGS